MGALHELAAILPSQLMEGKVVLYDSNYSQVAGLLPELKKQLKEIYALHTEERENWWWRLHRYRDRRDPVIAEHLR